MSLRARIDALASALLNDQGEDAVQGAVIRVRSGRRDGELRPDSTITALRCASVVTLRQPGEGVEALTQRAIDTYTPAARGAVPVLMACYREPVPTCDAGAGDG